MNAIEVLPKLSALVLRRVVAVSVLCGLVLVSVGRAEESARLIAELDGTRFETLAVLDKDIFVRDVSGLRTLPRGAKWKIEGDLRAAHERILFSPDYTIRRGPSDGRYDPEHHGHIAIVHVTFESQFTIQQLGNAIAVLLWLVDGKVAQIIAAPTPKGPSLESKYAALFAIQLTPELRRGSPAVMVWKDGEFMQPRATFHDPALNLALSEMHLGSAADFERAIAAIKSINARSTSDVTLLQYAAESGLPVAMAALRARKASLGAGNPYWGMPLHAAATLGRVEAVEWLIQANGSRQRRSDGMTPFDCALKELHVDVAALLVGEKWSENSRRLLLSAVFAGDNQLVKMLAARANGRLPRKTATILLARSIRARNAEILNMLLSMGAGADGDENGTPFLVLAAESGDVGCVEALLRAGASVTRTGKSGQTALAVAARIGADGVVQTLMRHGATGGPSAAHAHVSNPSPGSRVPADSTRVIYPASAVHLPPEIKTTGSFDAERLSTFRIEFRETKEVRLTQENQGPPRPVTVTTKTADFIGSDQRPDESWAVVRVVIEADGRATDGRLVDASTETFGQAVLKSLARFEFSPGLIDGRPVRTRMVLALTPQQ